MSDDDKLIISDLAWRILRRLAEGALTAQQMAEQFPLAGNAIEELVEHGFIKSSRVTN